MDDRQKRWRAKNRERVNEIARRSYHKNRDKIQLYQRATSKRRFLKHRYGLNEEDFERHLARQDHRCAICRRQPPTDDGWYGRAWNIDHDHVTGLVRGILCRDCNLGLGHFDDNPLRLRAALLYLRNPADNP